MIFRFFSKFIYVCAIISFFTIAFAEDRQPHTATFPVGIAHVEYFDVQRNQRPMVMEIIYPAILNKNTTALFTIPFYQGFKIYKNAPIAFSGKKYPLILLSHGRSGNRFNLLWLAAFLAAHGYIVATMDHYFANSYYLSYEYVASKIWERPIDVTTNINYLLNNRVWGNYIDATKIGVAGHSQGGMTGLWLGGAKINVEKFLNYQSGRRNDPVLPAYFKKKLPVDASPALNVEDKRVKAVFAMAPGALRGFGFDEDGFKKMLIPVYLIIGAGDTEVPLNDNAGFAAKYIPYAQLHIIPGPVGHEIFLNECDAEGKAEFPSACVDAPTVNRHTVHELIAQKALEFFDASLKGSQPNVD